MHTAPDPHMDLNHTHITVIGCGNMGSSLIRGLLHVGLPTTQLQGVDADPQQCSRVAGRYGIHCADTVGTTATELVILAVKPRQAGQALTALAALPTTAAVLSIMAGVRIKQLRRTLGGARHIVRAMPNLPACINAGITALYTDAAETAPVRELAETIMRAVGAVLWLEREQLMDAVTAVSGCGPAYFFLLMELLERHAVGLGLDPVQARQLALQSAAGAARLANTATIDTASLRQQVSSPGGATEAAVQVLLDGGLDELMARALQAAHRRSSALADAADTGP